MSQFFRALEQAERDRLRESQAEAASASEGTTTGAPADETPEPTRAIPATEESKPEPRSRPVATPVEEAPDRVFRRSLERPSAPRILRRRTGRLPMLVAQTDPGSVEADAYRTLRANIELMSDNGTFRHIAITSAAGGEGKSTTAANLAVVAAQGGRRVCLVDADLRRPTLHEVFGLPNVDGLVAALEHGRTLQAVAKPVDIDNLWVVVAGRGASENFQDVLTPKRINHILEEAKTAFDLVLFDSPPVIAADALSVSAACGGVILVVRAGSIPFSVLRRAVAQITQVKGRVVGVLLNRFDPRAADAYAYGAYHAARAKS